MKKCAVLSAAVAAMMAGAAAHAAPAIRVNVNGTPVAFNGTPPTEIQGAVLVPLRGVFQALGATVNYNGVTRVINAQKGSSTVVLPLGSTTATVNGQPQTLSQPAQEVGGTTLVPLRFVAQALGASVQWVPTTSTVEIKTAEPHLSSLPTAPGTGPVVGQATGVYTDTNPQTITVRVNGDNTVVSLSPNTILLRSAPGQPATEVALKNIQPGDQVTVQRDSDGAAISVTAVYGEVRGTIKSISGKLGSGDQIITLNDGTTVEVVPDVPVRMAGRRVTLGDVMANEDVVIRTNPSNKLGFGIAVVTPNNPNPTPPGQVPPQNGVGAAPLPPGATTATITSFADDVQGPLKVGEKITATLAGSPGGKASFAIPGVVESVPMKETSAGVYTGTYTVPKGVNISGAAVLGSLTANGVTAPLIQAAGAVTIAGTPPKVADFSPAKGATTESQHPLIYATFSDPVGIGVDPSSVHIRLDSTDITSQATVTPAFFNVTPSQPLAAGVHTVEVEVADKVGNRDTTRWQFTVAQDALVQSFGGDTAPGQTLNVGDTIRFTLKAQPGGKAMVDVGNVAKNIPLGEGSPGVYTGEYTVASGASAQNAPVVAQFKSASGQAVSIPLSSGLTIAAGPPNAPTITYPPVDDVLANDQLTVAGKATPGAHVRVSVDYVSKALGGLFAINGSAGTKEVTADKNGDWKAENLSLQTNSLFVRNQDTVFTISAVTVGANGDVSPPTTIKVRRA